MEIKLFLASGTRTKDGKLPSLPSFLEEKINAWLAEKPGTQILQATSSWSETGGEFQLITTVIYEQSVF